jgi:hypothetical protein
MPMSRQEMTIEELTTELHALRELPSEEFAAALDDRAADGFPGRRRGSAPIASLPGRDAAGRVAARFRDLSPRRKLLPALAGATTVIVAATTIVLATNGDKGANDGGVQQSTIGVSSGAVKAAPSQAGGAGVAGGSPREVAPQAATGSQAIAPLAPEPPVPGPGTAPGIRKRQIERSANLTLGTDPDQMQAVSGKVIDVLGRYRGIVLSSSVRDGGEGEAGATFEVLIPSGRLGAALTDLSAIADVRSRSENTLDITAPFVSSRERLRDARAEAEGLLRQLAAATTDSERASVKAQLRIVRGRIAAFRSQVNRLERRANFSHVSLEVVTGNQATIPGAGGGHWTIGDALHDAGRVLAVAAGVALLAMAMALPLALLGGAAWAARRIYLRRAREQTLSA